MKFDSTVRYPGDLASTTALLLDPGYLEFRLRKMGVEVVEPGEAVADLLKDVCTPGAAP